MGERVNKSVAAQRHAEYNHALLFCWQGVGANPHWGAPRQGRQFRRKGFRFLAHSFQTRIFPRFKSMFACSASAVRRARNVGTARSTGHVMYVSSKNAYRSSPAEWNGPSATLGGSRPQIVRASTGPPVCHPPPGIQCALGQTRRRTGAHCPPQRTCGQEGGGKAGQPREM